MHQSTKKARLPVLSLNRFFVVVHPTFLSFHRWGVDIEAKLKWSHIILRSINCRASIFAWSRTKVQKRKKRIVQSHQYASQVAFFVQLFQEIFERIFKDLAASNILCVCHGKYVFYASFFLQYSLLPTRKGTPIFKSLTEWWDIHIAIQHTPTGCQRRWRGTRGVYQTSPIS